MKHIKLCIVFAIAVIFCSNSHLFAQRPSEFDSDDFMFNNNNDRNVFFTNYMLPYNSADSLVCVSIVKVPYSRLVFFKTSSNPKTSEFISKINMEIVFQDNDGIIRNRQIVPDSIKLNNFEDTKSKDKYVLKYFYTILKRGSYSANLEIFDSQNKSLSKNKAPELRNIYDSKSPFISNPIYINSIQNNIYYPNVTDSALDIRSENPTLLFYMLYRNSHDISYTIKKIEDKFEQVYWSEPFSYKNIISINENQIITLSLDNQLGLVFKDAHSANSDDKVANNNNNSSVSQNSTNQLKYGTFSIVIPQEKLIPGRYEISIKCPDFKDTIKKIFSIRWYNMPLSLLDPEQALRYMQIILSDAQYGQLDKGNKNKVFLNILKYWKQFDPTPQTQYNEVLAEFFSRVDYVNFNFRSIRERDGSKTERGKIYILNGKPDVDETIPTDSGTKEVWTYNKIKKQYTFETNSSGFFKLKNIQDLP